MGYSEAIELHQAFTDGYFREQNIDLVLACVDDEIEWVGTEKGDCAYGKAEFRKLLERNLTEIKPSYQLHMEPPVLSNLTENTKLIHANGYLSVDAENKIGFDFRSTVVAIHHPEGWLIRSVHLSTPNTALERFHLEQKVKEDRTREQTLLARIPGGAAIYRLKKDGRMISDFATEGLSSMFGFDSVEDYLSKVGKDVYAPVVKEDLPRVKKALEISIENKTPVSITYRVLGRDSKVIFQRVDANLIASEIQPDDQAVWFAVHTVVSERAKEIIDSNEMLTSLVNEVPSGLGIYDIYQGEARLTYLNNAYYDLIQGKRDNRTQYYGTNSVVAVHKDDQPKMVELIRKLAEGADRGTAIYRVENNGVYHWLQIVASVVERKDGHAKVYTAFTNIDERMRVQKTLQHRYDEQVLYSKMLSGNSITSYMMNLTKRVIFQQNSSDSNHSSSHVEETPQQAFLNIAREIPDKQLRNEYSKIFNVDAIERRFREGIDHMSLRYPYQNFNTWLVSEYNAVINPNTHDLEVYYSAHDVTKEHQQDDVTRLVLSNLYEEAMLIDATTGEPQVMNNRGHSGVFDKQKELQNFENGQQRYMMANCADADPIDTAHRTSLPYVKAQLGTMDNYEVIYSIYNANHEVRIRRVSYTWLNSYHVSILCVVQDITDMMAKENQQRNQLEQALRDAKLANEAKTDFVSRMSHDMRTPMNGILGMVELSKDVEDLATLKSNLNKIGNSGTYLLGLINDTLDFQRIESGKLKLSYEPADSQEILNDIVNMVSLNAEEKGIYFLVEREDAKNWRIQTDPLRVKQIFINLLNNAMKFTRDGGIVKFKSEYLGKDGNRFWERFTISDTGLGMSEEFLKHGIFQPFSQEHNTVTGQYAGSGLGLSIVKRLVEMLGGTIRVESVLGEGTTFIVELPFEEITTKTSTQPNQDSSNHLLDSSQAIQGKRILLAEDHPLNAEITIKLLERKGCTITWCKDGQECLDTFQASKPHAYDAILMDIRMPNLNGLEASAAIRASKHPDAKSIPIIAMTANAFAEDVQASKDAGMNAHLSKPIDPNQLYQVLASFLSA